MNRLWRAHRSRTPYFAFTVIAVLTIGMSGTATALSLLDAIAFRKPPYPHSERLVSVGFARSGCPWCAAPVTQQQYDSWPDLISSVETWGAYRTTSLVVSQSNRRFATNAIIAEPATLQLFGIRTALGHQLRPEDNEIGGPRRVLISEALWRRHFDADSAAVGRFVATLDSRFEIAGVVDRHSSFPHLDPDIYLTPAASGQNSPSEYVQVVGRLHYERTLEQARGELIRVQQALARSPELQHEQVVMLSLRTALAARASIELVILHVLAALLLIASCANIASLLLARTIAERHIVALQVALGARRRDLLVHIAADLVPLAAVAVVAAFALTTQCIDIVARVWEASIPQWVSIRLNWRSMGLTVLVLLASLAGVAILPVRVAYRADLRAWLDQSSQSTTAGHDARRSQRHLVQMQLAAATVLLIAAVTLASGYRSRTRAFRDPQFERTLYSNLTADSGLSRAQLDGLLETIGAQQEVEYAWIEGRVHSQPTSGGRGEVFVNGAVDALAGDLAPRSLSTLYALDEERVSSRLVSGRSFSAAEMRSSASDVVVINETLARGISAETSALGRTVRFGGFPGEVSWRTVVGVIADATPSGSDRVPGSSALVPGLRDRSNVGFLVVTRVEAELVAPMLSQIASVAAPGNGILFESRASFQRSERARERARLVFMTAIASLALGMTLAGVASVSSYSASLRRREFAVRAALGASRNRLLLLALRDLLQPLLNGLALGALGGVVVAWTILPQFGGPIAVPWSTVGLIVVFVALTATAATAAVSFRIAAVDPAEALRGV